MYVCIRVHSLYDIQAARCRPADRVVLVGPTYNRRFRVLFCFYCVNESHARYKHNYAYYWQPLGQTKLSVLTAANVGQRWS